MALDRLSQITNSGISTTISFRSAGINVSGIVTASSFVGALTGNASSATTATIATYTSEWTLGANGSSDYTFTGPGLIGAENDPTLYLIRGQQYKFTNTMGAHPFRIQSTVNGSTGTQYNDGITNNDVSNGTLTWNVQFDTPNILYYQCTAHGGMGGKIYILNSEDNVSAGTTSAPSISPSGDSNTGIFFPSADTIAVSAGGTERVRVNSSGDVSIVTGNLIIGTSSITLDGSNNQINVGTGVTVGSSSITVGSAFIKNNAVGLGVTNTEGRNAGVSTATGTIIFNSNNAKVQVYNGTEWVSVGAEQYIEATGGTISDYTSGSDIYRAHIFTSSGSLSVTKAPATQSSVEYLVVAGGGGGGPGNGTPSAAGGGGGAGGLLSNHPNIPAPLRGSAFPVSTSPGSYTITIGAGGASAYDVSGNPGNPSYFGPPSIPTGITATGGGGGGNGFAPLASQTSGVVGSGGGGDYTAGGGSTPGQGNPGGAGTGVPSYRGGGGGGAGAPGTSQSGPSPAPGGDGLPLAIETSTAKYYAGGGGAGSYVGNNNPVGLGGLGGGGKGGSPNIPGAENGTYSTGGGGGGGPRQSTTGGSGIVVVRYLIGELAATAKATGGLISYASGKTIHQFLSSGTFTVTNPATAEFLVVGSGGGGASGNGSSGGGGAGGIVNVTGHTLQPGAYAVTINAGGAGGVTGVNNPGTVGGDVTVTHPQPFSITAKGGGFGGGWSNSSGSGGSGGGASGPGGSAGPGTQPGIPQTAPGATVTQYGNPGGAQFNSPGYRGGGGGGAGAAGQAGLPGSVGGTGGAGQPFSISGITTHYAGGGGGGTEIPFGGAALGGVGGGGPSGPGPHPSPGVSGTTNTGGGGGAGTYNAGGAAGGSGGSGIVIIAYPS